MKLKFKEQQYQIDAVSNIIRIFSGQTKGYRKETVGRAGLFVDEIFSNKKIEISNSDILRNTQELQREQGLHPVSSLRGGLNFTIEMETGTGKTYVYTRAMLELHKQYGWNKFIIMVPSVAIREGVYKSLEITQDHFQELYGKKIRFFTYDTKNKTNITNIQKFGNSADIEVIIMNHQAFGSRSQDSRKIFQELDVIQSQKPIDVIKRTRPILIIDEPQRFGPTAEGMLGEFNPLFILRFSATHKEDFNKIYRLDAIDAYNQKLVKKIKVKGIEIATTLGTSGYLYLERINVYPDRNPTATIEIEVNQMNGLSKKIRTVNEGDNLFELSGELNQYTGYVIREINAKTSTVSFTNGELLTIGQVVNDPYEKHSRQIQIRETIKSHIEKERELFKKGIKVLSLFFIDEVSKYRAYDEDGNQIKSEYEKIFEEEYNNMISQKTLFDEDYYKYISSYPVERIHNGYFSIDRQGRAIDSSETRGEFGSDDVNAYDLIMKDKEKLLSFEEPTRFIFSHSALREGWDNPNIFQICTLRHVDADGRKRQEIGRGLRIAVNQKGDRMDYETLGLEFFDINALTVIANESYDSFAKQLQKEILDSISDRPTKLEVSVLKGRLLINDVGEKFTIDETTSMKIIMSFMQNGYIDNDFKIQESLIEAIENKTFQVPEGLDIFKDQVSEIILDIYATNTYKPTENDLDNQLPNILSPNENFAKKEFQELWKKLKVKTVYTVDFDTDELIKNSIDVINRTLNVKKVIIHITGGEQVDELTEITLRNKDTLSKTINQIEKTASILSSIEYDVIDEIAKNTYITRKTSALILSKISIDKFAQFKENPEDFIKQVSRIINEQKATTLINKIKYDFSKENPYEDDIFTINNFSGSLKENILEVKRSIYNHIKTDSEIERKFAKDLDHAEDKVCVYAKLPSGFKITTPIGNYNPDWAIVFNSDDVKHVYFIAETKGSMSTMQLKKSEELKIGYAKKHFALLKDEGIEYDIISTYDDLLNKIIT